MSLSQKDFYMTMRERWYTCIAQNDKRIQTTHPLELSIRSVYQKQNNKKTEKLKIFFVCNVYKSYYDLRT